MGEKMKEKKIPEINKADAATNKRRERILKDELDEKQQSLDKLLKAPKKREFK